CIVFAVLPSGSVVAKAGMQVTAAMKNISAPPAIIDRIVCTFIKQFPIEIVVLCMNFTGQTA
ncbi:MAG: hypothetical protein LC660_08565, partial [Desulfobacteraceae bacterium]|nr:hypothetical protein [Desulfobacteraceae bacterium]